MKLTEKLSFALRNTPFYARPLCFLSAVFLGATFLYQISKLLFIIFAGLMLTFAVWHLFSDKEASGFKNPMPYLIAAVLILGVASPFVSDIRSAKAKEYVGAVYTCATVEDVYYDEVYGSMYLMHVSSLNGEPVNVNANVTFPFSAVLNPFDTVYFKAEASETEALEGAELLYAKSKGVALSLEGGEIDKVSAEARNGLDFYIYQLRSGIGARLDRALSYNTASYAKALLIGDTSGLSEAFRGDMSALGISHILAVSGMHMSIISLIVTFIAERMRSSRKIKSALIIVGAVVFAAIAGFSPSVTRAAIMLVIGMLAVFFGGKSDALTSLMLSCAIICGISCEKALSCSMLLSFFATLGIVLCALYAENAARGRLYRSRIGDMKRSYAIVRRVLFSMLVTLAATLFTVPVLSLYFSETSFFAIVMNPIAIPMAFVSMILSIICAAFGGVPIVGTSACKVFEWLFKVFTLFVEWVNATFTTSVSLKYPFFGLCLVLLAATLIFMLIMRVKNPIAVLSAFLICAVIFGSSVQIYEALNTKRCEVTYVAGKSSEAFLISGGGKAMLIDVGNGAYNVARLGVAAMKNDYYRTSLDAFMLTHYHSDHIGLVKSLLLDTKVKEFYLPLPMTDKETGFYDQIAELCGEERIRLYDRGEAIGFGDVTVQTVPFCMLERSTHPVISLGISWGNKSIAYVCGAIQESAAVKYAEELIAGSSAVILGAHNPKNKYEESFVGFSEGKTVYLSPFEEVDESLMLPGGRYVPLGEEGKEVSAIFDLTENGIRDKLK